VPFACQKSLKLGLAAQKKFLYHNLIIFYIVVGGGRMSHLKGQVGVITGGSSGIGFAIASSLIKEGMGVLIAARDARKLKKAEEQLKQKGGLVSSFSVDVSQKNQVEDLFKKVKKEFNRVDLLVNSAGIGRLKTIADATEEDWDQVLDINLKGSFLCTKAVLPLMRLQRSGYIINISSLAGKMGFGGAAAYSASKFGMVGFTESLLEEGIEDHIKATVICPGYVATPMVRGGSVPQEEMIPAEDIGKLVVGLLYLSPFTVVKEIVVHRKGAIGT
jgi:3-oxoacyl-[acyl-carrier protein] reductase